MRQKDQASNFDPRGCAYHLGSLFSVPKHHKLSKHKLLIIVVFFRLNHDFPKESSTQYSQGSATGTLQCRGSKKSTILGLYAPQESWERRCRVCRKLGLVDAASGITTGLDSQIKGAR
jgi:hypothetical protein